MCSNLKKIIKFIKSDYFKKERLFTSLLSKIKTDLIYKRCFNHIGKKTIILKPLRIENPRYMYIDDNVSIGKYIYLHASDSQGDSKKLVIGKGSQIGNMNHIASLNKVYIGKKVLTADRVYISDIYHSFEDIGCAIIDQPVMSKGPVFIGDECWIGENATIISCKVGKHSVIGANSVVLNDIPDYAVAVGAPARVVKRYNHSTKQWDKV